MLAGAVYLRCKLQGVVRGLCRSWPVRYEFLCSPSLSLCVGRTANECAPHQAARKGSSCLRSSSGSRQNSTSARPELQHCCIHAHGQWLHCFVQVKYHGCRAVDVQCGAVFKSSGHPPYRPKHAALVCHCVGTLNGKIPARRLRMSCCCC